MLSTYGSRVSAVLVQPFAIASQNISETRHVLGNISRHSCLLVINSCSRDSGTASKFYFHCSAIAGNTTNSVKSELR